MNPTDDSVERLPVWPMIVGMTRVMDGEITLSQFAADERINLSAEEQVEVGEYLVAIGAMVSARAQALVSAGLDVEVATELARAIVNTKVMHAMLRAEIGSHNLASFREVFGLAS
ncbi:MAG TPA: hypothetical protein DCQ98_06085 [Planctomycetaceae bacterium]|nr:hypothetical protein [Planctomycetaceae bacterium]